MTVQDFLDQLTEFDARTAAVPVQVNIPYAPQMPPCLQTLADAGLGDGQGRNVTAFNAAIFYKKAYPQSWQDELASFNNRYFAKALSFQEVTRIIKSVDSKRYQYQCSQSPLVEYCDRATCCTLEFGVDNKPWNEEGAFEQLITSNLRKLLTDPPRFILNVNGKDVNLAWEEFFNYTNFRNKVGEALSIVPARMKAERWELRVRELLDQRTDIEAPDDASLKGLIMDRFHDFLGLHERSDNRDDLLRGLPVHEDGIIYFRMQDLRKYLQNFKLDRLEANELFVIMRDHGCQHSRLRINGRVTTLWSLAMKDANLQTDNFKMPEFSHDEEEI